MFLCSTHKTGRHYQDSHTQAFIAATNDSRGMSKASNFNFNSYFNSQGVYLTCCNMMVKFIYGWRQCYIYPFTSRAQYRVVLMSETESCCGIFHTNGFSIGWILLVVENALLRRRLSCKSRHQAGRLCKFRPHKCYDTLCCYLLLVFLELSFGSSNWLERTIPQTRLFHNGCKLWQERLMLCDGHVWKGPYLDMCSASCSHSHPA